MKDVSEVNQPNARAAMVTSDYPEPRDSINRRGWPRLGESVQIAEMTRGDGRTRVGIANTEATHDDLTLAHGGNGQPSTVV